MRRIYVQTIAIVFSMLMTTSGAFAQACPACSNPAMQSSEKMEAGLDTLQKGVTLSKQQELSWPI